MVYQGYYTIKKPEKYIGDKENVIFRSSWELKMMKYFDSNKNVVKWSSEPFGIKYFNPIKKRPARYFPDFYVEMKTKEGRKKYVIEVKPLKETKPPKKRKQDTKKARYRYLRESAFWSINQEKWKQAEKVCKRKGWIFKIITEKNL